MSLRTRLASLLKQSHEQSKWCQHPVLASTLGRVRALQAVTEGKGHACTGGQGRGDPLSYFAPAALPQPTAVARRPLWQCQPPCLSCDPEAQGAGLVQPPEALKRLAEEGLPLPPHRPVSSAQQESR